MNHIGIDIGRSRIKIVVLDENNDIIFIYADFHRGKVRDIILKILSDLPSDILYSVGITGSFPGHGLNSFSAGRDADVIIKGISMLCPLASSVLDVGAERSLFINGLKSTLSIRSTSGCSSGTGSFFEEQLHRLNLSFNDLPGILSMSEENDKDKIPRIAGRCTVFARTDIIHRQQEGFSVSEILKGLAEAVSVSLKSGLLKGEVPDEPFLLSGGMSLNPLFVKTLGKTLKTDSIVVPEDSPYTGAVGAALIGKEKCDRLTLNDFEQEVRSAFLPSREKSDNVPLGIDEEFLLETKYPTRSSDLNYPLFLGIDVGSTSTNLVLIDSTGHVVETLYLRTGGTPGKTVLEGVNKLKALYEFSTPNACVTGSGRRLGAAAVKASLIRDEITAQSRGGSFMHPQADTIFEIGGQDSKFMRLKDGQVTSFRMNRVCAAGTGAFLEEQAARLGIPLDEFGATALKSKSPASLDERCTVFMETLVVRQLAEGRSREDIAAGLCYAVVRNYLQRVVGDEEIGDQILLQGGIAYNQGVVSAFRNITGKEILVPPYFDVTGALGAALIALDEQTTTVQVLDSQTMDVSDSVSVKKETNHFSSYEKSLLKNYTPPVGNDPSVIGIPRVLFIHKLFPLFNSFFRSLGFQVLLSGASDEDIVSRSGRIGQEETCYPVKLVNGHVSWLMEKGIDYLFLPSLLTMRHEGSEVRKNYACMFMQSLPLIMERNFDFAASGVKLLAPFLSLELGKKEILKALVQTGKKLGKNEGAILKATAAGMAAFLFFQKELKTQGKAAIKQIQPGKPTFVVVTRPYGLLDPELNKGIPGYLREMGYAVITLSHLPVDSYGVDDHPNLYWPFGQHILAGVEIIRKTPGLFLVYLTNHGCGPDTVLLHYVREKMKGEPFLHLEVDEHASPEGIKTRLEAFIRSERRTIEPGTENLGILSSFLPSGKECDLSFLAPSIYPLTKIISSAFSIHLETPSNETQLKAETGFSQTKESAVLSGLWRSFNSSLAGEGLDNRAVLLFQNEGAEVDGQYSRVIRNLMDNSGFSKVPVFSPFLEDLFLLPPDRFNPLWKSLLLHDLWTLWNTVSEEAFPFPGEISSIVKLPSFTPLQEAASAVNSKTRQFCIEKDYKGSILISGDPYIVYHEYWITGVMSILLKNLYLPVKIPLSELLFHLWKDKKGKNETGNLNLQTCVESMDNLNASLDFISPFASSPTDITTHADLAVPHVQGGFARYLTAKGLVTDKTNERNGIVRVSSLYENSASVVSTLTGKTGIPEVLLKYQDSGKMVNPEEMDNLFFILSHTQNSGELLSRNIINQQEVLV